MASPKRLPRLAELARRLVRCGADNRGAAAVEFSMFVGLFIIGLLNTVDVASYAYEDMEVQGAAQMGAQAGWKTCAAPNLPATTNCSGFSSAVSAAVQATSLGNSVTLASGSPSEGYYCVNSSGSLVSVSGVSNPPTDCSSVGNPGVAPGDYIQVQVQYKYTPIFTGITVGGSLPSSITSSSMMRIQ